jgi:hypothetical protein
VFLPVLRTNQTNHYNMKILSIGIIIVLILIGLFVVDKQATRKETIWLMDSMYSAKKKIINYDSIERTIKEKIVDSMIQVLNTYEWRQEQWIIRSGKRLDSLDSIVDAHDDIFRNPFGH